MNIHTSNQLTVSRTNRSPLRLGFVLTALALASLALSPKARAVCQQGCDLSNENTFLGDSVLTSNTSGFFNLGLGFEALLSNTTGFANTATGYKALLSNTGGFDNTATGFQTLLSNTTGFWNTATGWGALQNNTIGVGNTATGIQALVSNQIGSRNTALGITAGYFTTGSDNIDIGNGGVAGESGVMRFGTEGTQTATFIAGIVNSPLVTGTALAVGITSAGKVGVRASSARFKEAIKPMNEMSEAIFSLHPVSFRYKKELDPKGAPQFGLVAEEVAKVDPDLVVTDEKGRPFTVRYEEVNSMLLNEFLKDHRGVQDLKNTVAKQEARIAQQQQEIQALTAGLQKVSNQLEMTKPAARVVANN